MHYPTTRCPVPPRYGKFKACTLLLKVQVLFLLLESSMRGQQWPASDVPVWQELKALVAYGPYCLSTTQLIGSYLGKEPERDEQQGKTMLLGAAVPCSTTLQYISMSYS